MAIDGTPGDDFLTGGPLADLLRGFGGNDRPNGNPGADTLEGGDGNDTLFDGKLTFDFNGNFSHESDGDADVLDGGNGDDVLAGSWGDHFIRRPAYNGSGVTWTIAQAGADTIFAFSNGDQITLTNVTAANLVQTDPFGYN